MSKFIIKFDSPVIGPIKVGAIANRAPEHNKQFVALLKCRDENGRLLEKDGISCSYSTSFKSHFFYIGVSRVGEPFVIGSCVALRPVTELEITIEALRSKDADISLGINKLVTLHKTGSTLGDDESRTFTFSKEIIS